MIYIWLTLMIAFIILELATPQLVSLWFALGALASMISAWAGADLWLQIVIFIVISVAMLIVTRPLYRKFIKTKQVPTNADRLIGQSAVVTEDISNIDAKGVVKVCGQVWSARSSDGSDVPMGTQVIVEAIEGAKLIIKIK